MKKTVINFSDNITFSEKRLAKKVVKETLNFLDQPQNIEVCISVVSDAEIQDLNNKTRGVNKVTDVLSYPAQEITAGQNIASCNLDFNLGQIYLGDIIICRSQIERQAKEYGATYKEEFMRMVLHSMLHLLGYDHIQKDDEKTMKAVEIPIYEKIAKIKLN